MSMAPRDAKWAMRARRLAGQSGFTQLCWASPSTRTSGLPQTGQSAGKRHGLAPFGLSSSTGPTISGMTSPALWTITVSPRRTSLAAT